MRARVMAQWLHDSGTSFRIACQAPALLSLWLDSALRISQKWLIRLSPKQMQLVTRALRVLTSSQITMPDSKCRVSGGKAAKPRCRCRQNNQSASMPNRMASTRKGMDSRS